MMLKHIGKHNSKKIVLVYRQIPDEDHMCLVLYSDTLSQLLHDEVMTCLESAVGQQAESLADALFRNYMPDGVNSLEALHKNGLIKKIQTSQVIMTPTPASSVRLDELNSILNEMAKGEEAINRLKEIDQNRGITGKRGRAAEPREVGMPANSRSNAQVEGNMSAEQLVAGVLSDADLAQQRMTQAEQMRKNAESMLAEAARLEAEANSLTPSTTNGKTRKTTKAKATKKQAA